MKIVCSSSMPFAREAFGTLGEVTVLEGRSISAEDVKDATLLLVRSTTKVDRELIEGSRVKFVGTATIGIDHLDVEYLRDRGVHWCAAPGCNATSVSEYITAALLCLAERHCFSLQGRTIGVVGVGNVGSRVILKAQALGMQVLANDPPRQRTEGDNVSLQTDAGMIETEVRFVDLEHLLAEADVVTLHVPLTREGRDKTFHMLDDKVLNRVKPGCIVINSARGAVVDTNALIGTIRSSKVSHAVIDTWECEPAYSAELLGVVDLGTPHIAGYSFDGKVRGTEMVYLEACRFLSCNPGWDSADVLSSYNNPVYILDAAGRSDEELLCEIIRSSYDICADDRHLRETLVDDPRLRAKEFDRLRKDYPVRREFPFTRLNLCHATESLRDRVSRLGFVQQCDSTALPRHTSYH